MLVTARIFDAPAGRTTTRRRLWPALLVFLGFMCGPVQARPSAAVAEPAVSITASDATRPGGPGERSPILHRILSSGVLRVCIWPDYYGVTYRHPRDETLSGIDIDLSSELAKDLNVRLRYVESSFQRVVADVDGDRCDVAMFAIGALPQRLEQLAFTRPYMQSDIYGITTRSSRLIKRWEDIDQAGVVVAVQPGTFMEEFMRRTLSKARLMVVQPPSTRERELESGRADVFMTDFPYSRRLLANADWARLVAPPKPISMVPYAYAVKKGDAVWLARMDAFVAAIKRDGRLRAAAQRHGLSDIVVP